MIDAQISSYRMNVEGEMLLSFLGGSGERDDDDASSAASSKQEAYFKPSQLVLDRLQNNVSSPINLKIPSYKTEQKTSRQLHKNYN